MDEINFISNKEAEKKRKKRENQEKIEEIKWSKPIDDKPQGKDNSVGWLSLVAKENENKPINRKTINKSLLKNSRLEVLKLIKKHESEEQKYSAKNRNIKNIGADRKKGGFFSWLKLKLKKKNTKEVLVDYHQVFESEKIKKKQTPLPEKPIIKNDFVEETKRAEATDKIKDEGWFRKFIKALNRKSKKVIYSKQVTKVPPAEEVSGKPSRNLLEEKVRQNKTEILPTNKEKIVKTKEKDDSKKWINPDILETNLIKDEIATFFNWRQKIFVLINVVILSVLIVGAAYGGLIIYKKRLEEENLTLKEDYKNLVKQIKETGEDLNKIALFQRKLKIARTLLIEHIYWTNFFKLLENKTIADVYYNNFGGDISGNYVIGAIARNYNNIEQQVDALKGDKNVTKARVVGGKASGQSAVSFSLEFSINPQLFKE